MKKVTLTGAVVIVIIVIAGAGYAVLLSSSSKHSVSVATNRQEPPVASSTADMFPIPPLYPKSVWTRIGNSFCTPSDGPCWSVEIETGNTWADTDVSGALYTSTSTDEKNILSYYDQRLTAEGYSTDPISNIRAQNDGSELSADSIDTIYPLEAGGSRGETIGYIKHEGAAMRFILLDFHPPTTKIFVSDILNIADTVAQAKMGKTIVNQ